MSVRRQLLSVLALLCVLLPASVAMAAVGPTDEQLDDANDTVDRLDEQIDGAERDLATVEEDLARLDSELATANEVLLEADAEADAAQRAADLAAARADQTRQELDAALGDLADNRRQLDDVVRDTFMFGSESSSPVLAAIEQVQGGDPAEVADALHYVQVVVGERGLAVEDTQRLITRTEQLTRETLAAQETSAAEAAEATAALDEAAAQHAEVMALTSRTDAAVREQQALLTGLESDRTDAAQRVEDLEDAARRAAEEADAAVVAFDLGNGLVEVGGITVAASLAPALEDLLEAARADGYVLGGHGYRSPETTARLRRANGCPDVYDSPASSCRVPTARPGESMHEQGLAVDFIWQGQTICYPRSASRCSGNAAFDWLTANAGRFGLQVLSSEAWHWSTNGD